MNSLNTGAPHFKSIAKQHRHANYTLEKVINECVDNVIKKATEIHITTDVDDYGRLQELKISDNYINGFDSINQLGIHNPFNMGHIKRCHDDDNETSEFGVGLKAGALSAANQLLVISQVDGVFHEVNCDFIKMEREEDVNASYNPKIREITETDYNQEHPFPFGSSIIMSKIRETICERMNQNDLTLRIKKGISDTYSRFLTQNMKIFVNGHQVENEIDLFSDKNCQPFTIHKCLYVLKKHSDTIILAKKTIERPTWQIYDKNLDKWEVLKEGGEEYIKAKLKEGYVHLYNKRPIVKDMSCIDIDTTFAFYSDLFHSECNEPEKPFDNVLIYKDDRKYGKRSIIKHNDGNNNFTLHKIEFISKKIGKDLGITFNKEITLEGSNELILAIKSSIADSRKEFNANISTGSNHKLCEKAVKRNIINWQTCNINKLSSVYRDQRIKLQSESVPEPVLEPVQPLILEPVQPLILEPVQPLILEPVIEPVTEPIPQPIQQPIIEPIQQPIIVPIQQPIIVQQPIPQPIIDPVHQLIVEPIQQPILEPIQQPIQPSIQPLILEPIQQPIQPSIQPLIIEPIPQPTDPVPQLIVEPIQQPILEPIQPSIQPLIIEPIPQPTDPVPQLIVEPIIELIEQPIPQPIIDPVQQPTDPVLEPTIEPVLEPKQILINASNLLMIKALSENCDTTLEDSIRILEFINSILTKKYQS
jgi:hypothetical protein